MKIVSIILLALLQYSSYTLAQTTGGGGREDVIAGLAAQGQNSTVPTITSFSPTSGCQGSGIVTITGTFFTGATAVSIGGTAVSTFTVDSATQITATVGSGTSGTIQVTTPAGTTTSSGTFTVNPLPSAAGSISGPATVCQGQNSVSYTVPAIANASTYLWTLPTGASITSGSNTNSITVNYSITASSGPITVQGTNTCGNGMVSAVPGANDPTFNASDLGFGIGDAANGDVHATTLQPDGKILIGGDFISYNGTARTCIARLNANGYLDPSFNPGSGPSNSVYTIALQTDGKMIIGGQFIQFNIAVRNRIARLNADGSLDVSFNPGTGANSTIWITALQPDGKVLIGGDFTSYNGTARNRIARLNADGSLDIGFNPGTGADGSVQTIALQADGKILIGGLFTSCNGTASNRIARLNADGSLDTNFNPGTGANGDVRTTAVQSDGKILIGGDFTSFNGTTRIRIARMNADGSLDVDFNPGAGANGTVRTNTLRPDGKILIGGGFINYNFLARIGVALLNADGSLDTSFNPNPGTNGIVQAITIQSNGKIVIGGTFTQYNPSTIKNRIVRLNTNGSLDTGFNSGTGADGTVLTTALQPDGKIIIGGTFSSYNGTVCPDIARLNTDGSIDTSFNPGTGTNGTIRTTALQPDGKILIGGDFTSYNGTTRNRIARLNADGSLDASFNHQSGAASTVSTTALQPDGKILIGGDFATYNGTSRNRIARLNADGSLDTGFNPGTGASGFVRTTTLQPDGKILIGGNFTSYNGTARNGLARLNTDGSTDAGFTPGSGPTSLSPVRSTALQPDGKILIGGDFTTYNGAARNGIARLNADGSLDSSFNPGGGANSTVYTIVLQPDGKILIGGDFSTYNFTGRNRIARLNANGSLDASFNPGTGANNYVYTIAHQADDKIFIGGGFTSYNGTGRNRIARAYGAGLFVTVNPLPFSAGSISGLATVCQGQNAVIYTVPEIVNASGYLWNLPTGASIAWSNNNVISVNYSASANSGSIRVRGTNSCGNGTISPTFSVTVNKLPSPAGSISGQATVCQGQNGVSYTVPVISNASTYLWTLPTGASIASGSNTRSITVNYSASASSGAITVQGTNTCGNGTISPAYAVSVNTICSLSVSIRLFTEGFYIGNNLMTSALFTSGQSTNSLACDSITVELRDPLSPSVSLFTQKVTLQTNGLADISVPFALSGINAFIVVRHRNSIETWSKIPVLIQHNLVLDFRNP